MRISKPVVLGALLATSFGCPAADDGGLATGDTGSGTASDDAPGDGSGSQGATSTTGNDGSGSADSSDDVDSDSTVTSATSPTSADSGGSSDGGSDGSTTGTSLCKGQPITDLDSAIAILVGDIPPPPPPGGGTTAGSDTGNDGGGLPDDSLRIELANVTITCADPYVDYACGPTQKWNVSLTIPAEMQAPGVYDLADLNFGYSVVEPGVGKDCAGGGGGSLGGTLTIDAIGPDGVVGCIETDDIFDFDANGTFEAEMCG